MKYREISKTRKSEKKMVRWKSSNVLLIKIQVEKMVNCTNKDKGLMDENFQNQKKKTLTSQAEMVHKEQGRMNQNHIHIYHNETAEY